MIQLQFGNYNFKTKQLESGHSIFDPIRRKWLKLTPEEWVRQNIIQYLIITKKYPASLFSLEKELHLGELKKRCDIVVYKQSLPWMIIECKEQQVQLSDAVLMQVLRYQMALPVDFLVITNGAQTYAWQKVNGQLKELQELPEF